MTTIRFRHAVQACAVFMLSGLAQASTVTTVVFADWSQFSIAAVDFGQGAPAVSWNFQDSAASVQVFAQLGPTTGNTSQFGSINNWTTELNASGMLLGSEAVGIAGANAVSTQANSGAGSSFLSASASRGGSFTVSGTGLLIFSVPYQLTGAVSIDPAAPFGDYGSMTSQISIAASSFLDGQSSSGSEMVFRSLYAGFPGEVQTYMQSGVLVSALSVQDGASGFFSVSTSLNTNALLTESAAAVPVPPGLLLLASALFGLAATGRRS